MSYTCLHKLYYNVNMYINYIKLRELLEGSCKYDLDKTINIIFYIRDCRNGKGLREIGRLCYQWLLFNYPDEFKEVLHYIPNVGRWDDLYSVFPRRTYDINLSWIIQNNNEHPTKEKILKIIECQQTAVQIYIERLKDDLINIKQNERTSLASKWAVTEKSSLNRKFKFVNVTCNQWGITKKQYRQYISKLRKSSYSIERILTNRQYNQVQFSRIPKMALIKYKNVLFEKEQDRFMIYLSFVKLKKDIFDVKKYTPFDIVMQYNRLLETTLDCEVNDKVEDEWDKIILEANARNIFKNSTCILDTTGSMYQQKISNLFIDNKLPINIGVAFSILIARCTNKPFNNIVMNFSKQSEYIFLRKDETLHESMEKILNFQSDEKLNLKKILEKILETTNFNNKIGMIKNIVVFSDKPISKTVENFKDIIKEVYDKKYSIYDFKIPDILYFNINTGDIQFNIYNTDYNEITEISGFSYEIFREFLRIGEIKTSKILSSFESKYFLKA